MEPIALAEDLVPLGEFKATASQRLKALKGRTRPLVVTVNGRAAAVVISPEAWDQLQSRERFLAAVDQGIADADAGRLVDADAVRAWLQQTRPTP